MSKVIFEFNEEEDRIEIENIMKRNDIDKLACSEFWKAPNSDRQLQNAFYDYMVSNGFKLERDSIITDNEKFKVYKICKMQEKVVLLT